MNRYFFPAVILLFFVCFFIASVPYYSGDVKNHLVWANSILNDGAYGLYSREFKDFSYPNYPPVAMGLFVLSLEAYQVITQIVTFLNLNMPIFPSNLVHYFESENVKIAFLKLPAILANIAVGVGIYLMLGKIKNNVSEKSKWFLSSTFLLNPAAIYISVIWGQIDMLPLAFLIFGIYFLIEKKMYYAFVLMTFALLSKQTVILFLPIFLVFAYKQFGFKKIIRGLFTTGLIFYLSYLPFYKPSIIWPIQVYKQNFNNVAFSTSPGALNFWGAISDFRGVSDLTQILFLTYQQWGYLLFAVLFIPFLYIFCSKKLRFDRTIMLLFLTTIFSFFVLTRMHERYLVPAVVFGSILPIFNKKFYFALLYFTFIHFLNLYRNLLQPDMLVFNILSSNILFMQFLMVGYFSYILFFCYLYFLRTKNE